MTEEYYIVKAVRQKDNSIVFFLYGLFLHVNNATLCPTFIKEELNPNSFDYNYDFFDTFEQGYFTKDNIRVSIGWSIYTGYEFTIDKYSSSEQIEKIRTWVILVFNFLVNQKGVEKSFYQIDNFAEEPIIPFQKPNLLRQLKQNFRRIFKKQPKRVYYIYGKRPVYKDEIESIPHFYAFQWDTGEFKEDMSYWRKIYNDISGDAEKVSEQAFYLQVEKLKKEKAL